MTKHHLKHAGFFLAIALLLSNIITLGIVATRPVNAAGVPSGTDLTLSISTASTTTGSSITFNLFSYVYVCNQVAAGTTDHYTSPPSSNCDSLGGVASTQGQADTYTVDISGSGNTTSGITDDPNLGPLIRTDASGHGSFTLTSSVAESKTVQLGNNFGNYTKTVTFTAPVAPEPAPVSTNKTTTPTTKTTPAPISPAAAPPTTVSAVSLNGDSLENSDSSAAPSTTPTASSLKFTVGDPIVVSGTAAPNAKVKVYVFSTPQTAEVTANASGKWTYTLPALPAGAHHIEAAIISSDGTEGPRQVLGAFTVVAKKTAHPVLATLTTPAKKTSGLSPAGLLLIAGLSLLAIAYIVWYWWHHRSSILNHHKKGDQDSTTPSNPTPTFTPGN